MNKNWTEIEPHHWLNSETGCHAFCGDLKTTCEPCKGKGKRGAGRCRNCGGSGKTTWMGPKMEGVIITSRPFGIDLEHALQYQDILRNPNQAIAYSSEGFGNQEHWLDHARLEAEVRAEGGL